MLNGSGVICITRQETRNGMGVVASELGGLYNGLLFVWTFSARRCARGRQSERVNTALG